MPQTNWFIYEADLLRLSCKVCYTNNIIKKRRSYTLKDAVITYPGGEVPVRMKCYTDGTCVLLDFLEQGLPMKKLNAQANRFVSYYKEAICNNDTLLDVIISRTVKLVLAFILQMLCVFALIHSIIGVFSKALFLTYLIEGILSVVLFCMCPKLYSSIRVNAENPHEKTM